MVPPVNNLIGDLRFPVSHRFNYPLIPFLGGLQIKVVQGPYSTGVGEIHDPTGVGQVHDPTGIGIVLNGEG